MTIRYKNDNELPIIELGVLTDKIQWLYDLEPIENQIIDKLGLVWSVVEQDGLILLQKEKKYDSIEDFLRNYSNFSQDLPSHSKLSQYYLRLTPLEIYV